MFTRHCIECHGVAGVGADNWRVREADGSFPAPPLNGTAHTWHHPMSVLKQTIERGGISLGGKMPGFADKLSSEEQNSIIAYFQHLWPDRIYHTWLERVEKPAKAAETQ